MRIASLLACCVLVVACSGKSGSSPAAAGKAKGGTKFDATADAKADAKADGGEAKADGGAAPDAKAEAGTPVADAKAPVDRGERFLDPPWFRETLFENATNKDFKRSELDENGLFSSQFLFDLPESETVDTCVKTLQDKTAKYLPDLERTDKDGRVTLRGKTDRYETTFMCGEAKGVMKAYVSFRWTS